MSYIPSITLPAFAFETPAVSILLPVASGTGIGYLVGQSAQGQYRALKQPPFAPPAWVFGPVWTVLYSLMGYGAYRAWDVGMSSLDPSVVEATKQGATLYTVQLALNLAWSPLFFGLKQATASAVDIVALVGSIGGLIYTWKKVDSAAAYCLLPYLGWVSFATYLSVGISYLNDWDLRGPKDTPPQKAKEPKTQ